MGAMVMILIGRIITATTLSSSMSRVGSCAIVGLDLIDFGLILAEVCLCFCRCHMEFMACAVATIVSTWAFVKEFADSTLRSFSKCSGNAWLGF